MANRQPAPAPTPAAPRDPSIVCETCHWWDNSIQHRFAEPDTTGLCRVKPPVPDERNGRACWPFTEDSDWCGSHSPEVNWR